MNNTDSLIKQLRTLSNSEKAILLKKFFKTGPNQYAHTDKFLGISIPVCRMMAKKYINLTLAEIRTVLQSDFHECRVVALFIAVLKYEKALEQEKTDIFKWYIHNIDRINNWDLVDLSCYKIVGDYLQDKKKDLLYEFACSPHLWLQRIAIVSTFAFIKQHQFNDSLNIAELLLSSREDLIHKAVGWMLREIGKRDQPALEQFLRYHYRNIPRTTLRYAIERFSPNKRVTYLRGIF